MIHHSTIRSMALVTSLLMTAACSVDARDGKSAADLASTGGLLVAAARKIVPNVNPLMLPTVVVGASQVNSSFVTITETSQSSGTGALVVARESGDAEIVSGAEGCSGNALAAGGSCLNAYRLDCTTASEGDKTATFTVTDPDSFSVARYSVSGTCDAMPTGSAFLTQTATSNEFGVVYLGAQATASADMTVTNDGNGITGTLVSPILSSKVGDANFRYTGDCSTGVTVLAPGDTCSLSFNLDCRSPATAGTQGVTVLEYDPTSGTNVTFDLTGSCACRPTAMACTSSATCCSGTCTAGQCT